MSDEERTNSPDSDAPLTGDVRDTALVRQGHGGAIRSGPAPRLLNPTATDTAQRANRYLYATLPKLRRVARNKATRPKTKRGTPNLRIKPKPEFTVEQQLSAFRALADIAKLDRTVRAAAVDEFIAGIIDDVRSQVPRENAEALLAMFKNRARRI